MYHISTWNTESYHAERSTNLSSWQASYKLNAKAYCSHSLPTLNLEPSKCSNGSKRHSSHHGIVTLHLTSSICMDRTCGRSWSRTCSSTRAWSLSCACNTCPRRGIADWYAVCGRDRTVKNVRVGAFEASISKEQRLSTVLEVSKIVWRCVFYRVNEWMVLQVICWCCWCCSVRLVQ